MALKLANSLLVFIITVSIGYASYTSPSAFDFIKNLEGCGKGNATQGIYQLKTYLKRFGYIEHLSETQANNDVFDDILESAIKTYQANYKIKPTGIIDAATVSRMTAPRCGVADIINGVNHMRHRSSMIHTVSHYAYVTGNKWEPSNRHLTYKFLGDFPEVAKLPAALAFKRWASVTRFTFSEVEGLERSDLTLEFVRRDHGDGLPFDGEGGVLAHAFYPTNGRLHFDLDDKWFYLFINKNATDLLSVSLHEIGHLLGLQHSTVEAAIMYPTFKRGETKDLDQDDILGIKALYKL
ncbi:metalloendoproteinase 2-MMP-like [Salvia divinorum]|uniref:Metalloendoproteinase 2-MMP-like n=1 Tax=Salvia divinorum TaxID=28513 RepID=A0ABD1I2X1_SALDI